MARKAAASSSSPSTVFILAESHPNDLVKIISVHPTHDAADAAAESIEAGVSFNILEHEIQATAPTKAAPASSKSKKAAPSSTTTTAADPTRSAAFHTPASTILSVPDSPPADTLASRAICFTGELTTMKRKEAQGLAEAAGAKVHGSITKTVNLVVLGKDAGPKKLEQIRKQGIEMIDEKTFLEWVGSGGPAAEGSDEDDEDEDEDEEEEEQPKKKRARGAK
ncbi:hypothetical protein K490DRAFT_64059 [Saccharata proteae CBS 121410]|uniref:BRCT domain-containing protein n=1 Tax=Saccharata proteae CBS 121410 TaxID=1314787 RepID=A0A6A5YAV9_9PEZI|nr:hypothetical protein K490DRAFT_64059 [Saccharata proteae CBS 121410]